MLQTTYLKIAEGRATFAGRSTLKTWLFGVVRNTARERRRQRGSRLALLQKWSREPAPARTPDDEFEESAQAVLLRRALEELSERQREVLELVFYHDMTIEEASTVMEVSLGTARTHYDRGKKAMAAKLEHLRD